MLVGRAIEQAIIDELLRDAEGGVAAAVLFAGPPGIGKSALVDYAIDVASDFRVVRIVGVESEMTVTECLLRECPSAVRAADGRMRTVRRRDATKCHDRRVT